jgi:hypothetical protein
MDSNVHADSNKNIDYDFLDVMVLRKGRKIKHRKKQLKKEASPKFRCTPNRRKEADNFGLPPILFDDRPHLELLGSRE